MHPWYRPTGRAPGASRDTTLGQCTHMSMAQELAQTAKRVYGGDWRVDVLRWQEADKIDISKPDIVEQGAPV